MKYHRQLFQHRPEQGEFGDCHRSCIASILDKESVEDVPNFGVHYDDHAAWGKAVKEYLLSQGLAEFHIAYNGSDGLDSVLTTTAHTNPGMIAILAGISPSGFCHSVVIKDGHIIHDPAGYDTPIVGPVDGLFWVTVLVSSKLMGA